MKKGFLVLAFLCLISAAFGQPLVSNTYVGVTETTLVFRPGYWTTPVCGRRSVWIPGRWVAATTVIRPVPRVYRERRYRNNDGCRNGRNHHNRRNRHCH